MTPAANQPEATLMKRYYPEIGGYGKDTHAEMKLSSDGDYVRFEDHEQSLAAERAAREEVGKALGSAAADRDLALAAKSAAIQRAEAAEAKLASHEAATRAALRGKDRFQDDAARLREALRWYAEGLLDSGERARAAVAQHGAGEDDAGHAGSSKPIEAAVPGDDHTGAKGSRGSTVLASVSNAAPPQPAAVTAEQIIAKWRADFPNMEVRASVMTYGQTAKDPAVRASIYGDAVVQMLAESAAALAAASAGGKGEG